jgi:hypothetical protein
LFHHPALILASLSPSEANLTTLNQSFQLPQIPDLIACKVSIAEKAMLPAIDLAFHQQEYQRLCQALEAASDRSHLPDTASAKEALHKLLVKIRLGSNFN